MLSANVVGQITRPTPFLHLRPTRRFTPTAQVQELKRPPNGMHPKHFSEVILKAHPSPVSTGLPDVTEGTSTIRRLVPNHGTTTIAFSFKGGILLAVDSRSTQGPFISSGIVEKVIEITPNILGTIAGVAGDCQYWERSLACQCRLYELENGEKVHVSSASNLFINMLRQNADADMSVGAMISGFDAAGHPRVYYCDSEGTRIGGYLYGAGSGSTFAFSVVDNEYRFDMTEEEAIALGKKALFHAVSIDAMSGGMINIFVIRPDGWERVDRFDNYQYYRQLHPEAPALPPPPQ